MDVSLEFERSDNSHIKMVIKVHNEMYFAHSQICRFLSIIILANNYKNWERVIGIPG